MRVAAEVDVNYLKSIDWWAKVDTSGGECWPWLKSTGSHGYGQTWDGITVRLAHRVAWVLTYGPIPPDLTIDHRCRNRICCNPGHLRLLSNEVNGQANGHTIKTECPRGHPYDGENTYVDPKGHRRCRQCNRDRIAKGMDDSRRHVGL